MKIFFKIGSEECYFLLELAMVDLSLTLVSRIGYRSILKSGLKIVRIFFLKFQKLMHCHCTLKQIYDIVNYVIYCIIYCACRLKYLQDVYCSVDCMCY